MRTEGLKNGKERKPLKKWMIGLAAAGGVFCLAGVGMIAAGVMMYGTGGRQAPPWLVRIEEDFSAVSEELEEIPECPMEIAAGDTGSGDKSEGAGTAGTAGANENAGNSEGVKTESSIPNGQIYENVRSLELETVSEQVQIVETEDLEEGQIQVVQSGDGADYRVYQEGGELKIRLPRNISRNTAGNLKMKALVISIPVSYEFDQIELEHVAGSLYAERLFAREISVEMISGTADIAGGSVKELEIECISGSCRCMAAAEYSASVENISGDTSICLAGAEDDFDYEIEAGGGSIYFNGEEQRAFENSWKESHLNYHTGREVELSCASGTITVEYE